MKRSLRNREKSFSFFSFSFISYTIHLFMILPPDDYAHRTHRKGRKRKRKIVFFFLLCAMSFASIIISHCGSRWWNPTSPSLDGRITKRYIVIFFPPSNLLLRLMYIGVASRPSTRNQSGNKNITKFWLVVTDRWPFNQVVFFLLYSSSASSAYIHSSHP